MFDPVFVGALGGIVIAVSWAYETIEAVKKHKSLIDLKFAAINITGTLLLLIYSWQIGNSVFLWLNIILFSIELIEIGYSIAVKKIHKAAKKRK